MVKAVVYQVQLEKGCTRMSDQLTVLIDDVELSSRSPKFLGQPSVILHTSKLSITCKSVFTVRSNISCFYAVPIAAMQC